MKRISILALCLACVTAAAQGARGVPVQFEGIKLGAELPADSPDRWGLDVKATAPGVLGTGMQLWFKPKKENPELPFRELDLKPGDEAKTTSHRLYLVPVLPDGIESHPDPFSQRFKSFRVHRIDWSDDRGKKSDHYWWAIGMCNALAASLGAKPTIIDNIADNFYSCEFKEGNRRLEADSFVGRKVSLSYSREYTEAELAKISRLVNKARGNRVLGEPSK